MRSASISKALKLILCVFTAFALSGTAVAKKKKHHNKNISHVTVKFCGFSGPDSNYETLDFFDHNPNFRDHFKAKDMYFTVLSFNGKDRLRITPRSSHNKLHIGGQKTFRCNKKKNGCKFKIRFIDHSGATAFIDNSYHIQKQGMKEGYTERSTIVYKFYDFPYWSAPSGDASQATFTIRKVRSGGGHRPSDYCVGDSALECHYTFKDIVLDYKYGSLACD